jgi:hypothetical protein
MRLLAPLLLLLASCAVVESESARNECLVVFDAFEASCTRCEQDCYTPSRSVCDMATSYDEKRLSEVCLPWLADRECVPFTPDDFRAHCAIISFLDL